MPKPHRTAGKATDLVAVQVKMTLELKRMALQRAHLLQQDLSSYIRALIVADVGIGRPGGAGKP